MKTCILAFCLLGMFSFSVFAGDPTYNFYGFVGAGIGYGKINTDIVADFGDKEANPAKFTIIGKYYHRYWAISAGGGYYMIKFKNDLEGENSYKLITDSFYLNIAPHYRFGKRWSIGGSLQYFIGQELLIAPSSFTNVNNEKTTNTLVGLVVDYDIPFKKFRMKTGLSFHKPMAVGTRDVFIAMLNFQFGVPIYDNEERLTKIIYKTKEVIKMVPAEVIVLGEQVVNFDSGKHNLNSKSKKFLEEMATLLSENPEFWELIKIVGHTDARGSDQSNLRLSERRVQSVKDVFLSGGASSDRVFAIGMGETKLKSQGKTAVDHKINRRVELQFVGQLDKDFVEKVKELIKAHTN
jgi:outer membrane protein OmpA-like peptidoglycan-associated protein